MIDAKPLAEAIAALDEQGRFRARPLLTTRDLFALVKGWLGIKMSPAEIRDCLVAAGLAADSRYHRFRSVAVRNAAKPGGRLWRLAQQVAVNDQALIDNYLEKYQGTDTRSLRVKPGTLGHELPALPDPNWRADGGK